MKNSKYSQFLDSLIGNQIPQNLNLAPKILSKIQKQKGAMMNKRKKVLIPTAVVLMMMSVITLTVPAVAETFQRWIGYIPGFGLVHDDKVRTLVEPQNQTLNGITLSVDEVIVSSDKTLVKYSLLGVEGANKTLREICPGENPSPIMSLSDGSKLTELGLGVYPGNGIIQFEATYSSHIPLDEKNVTFNLQCLWQTGNGSSLSRFQIPLRLTENGVVELTVAPVVVIPTQEVAESTSELSSGERNLEVNQVIPLKDGYILQGTLTVEPESGLTVNIFNGFLEDITILDANNVALVPSMVPDDFMVEANEVGGNKINWAIQVNGISISWPLTITVNSIPATTEPYAVSTFQVNVGENPQPGQEWVIEKEVPLGPKMVHVDSIKRVQNDLGMNGYEITFIYNSSLEFSYGIAGAVAMGGGGQGGTVNGDPITITRSFMGVVPTGVLTVELTGRGVESIQGPWQVVLAEPVY
jgi:hypothetical protein